MAVRLIFHLLLALLGATLPVLSLGQESTYDKANLYKERYRPAFHFNPEAGWMNDPNGMVYYEGVYHLYYQYVPPEMYGKKARASTGDMPRAKI